MLTEYAGANVYKRLTYVCKNLATTASGGHSLSQLAGTNQPRPAKPSVMLLDIHAEVLGCCAVGVTPLGQAQPS